jgi:hypothetical protein
MVEHVRQGGKPYDMRGQHIVTIIEELNVLSRFRRASKGQVFEGDTANLVAETNRYYETMCRTVKGLSSSKGYNSYFESWNPGDVTEQDLIIEDIKTLFVQETIDSRIEQALPILARIQQQGTAMKEANIFETWANRLMEGTWATPDTPEQQQKLIALLSQELPVGADATNATEQLYDLVGDDILFDQLADLADQDANADCRSVVVTRIKQMADSGFNDFVPVLDALKAEQMVASAPPQPQPPVAEEEYSVDGGMNNELLQDYMEENEVWVDGVTNQVKIGKLAGNRNLEFGVRNILEEYIQEAGYALSDNAGKKIKVEIVYLDVLTTKTNISVFHRDNAEVVIRLKGILYKDGKKVKEVMVEESSSEISMSTLIVDGGGKFNQTSLSNALKKGCGQIITKLLG